MEAPTLNNEQRDTLSSFSIDWRHNHVASNSPLTLRQLDMYTWWLELYPTGVESFPGSHGGMGSLFSTCCRQPQVMGTTCTMEHCLNSALLFFLNVVTGAYLIGQSLYNQSINQYVREAQISFLIEKMSGTSGKIISIK